MKILSVTAQKPHSTGSGVFLTELVNGFAGMGMRQAVICGLAPGDDVNFPDEVRVYPVHFETAGLPFPVAGMSDEMPYPSTRYSDLSPTQTGQFRSAFIKQVDTAVKEFKPDVILCHHLYFLTALVRTVFPGQKVFGVCHGSDLRQIRKNPLEREFIRTQIKELDGIFALHQVQKAEIAQIYGVDPGKINVTGIGYNSSIFFPVERPIQGPTVQLIFAGKVTEKKGVISLIRSLELLDDKTDELILKLAGGSGVPEEYEKIQELAAECKYPVAFLGCLTQQELAAEFNQSHIFILPSFYEGLPLVTVEAMACGLKVIVTDLPGIRQWLAAEAKGNEAIYVTPPEMSNTDVPDKESLGLFERRLAAAIRTAIQRKTIPTVDLTGISWKGVCEKIIGAIEKIYK